MLLYIYIIIIIIIIWHYNPFWVFEFSARSFPVLLSLAVFFQFFIFSFSKSSTTSSCHRCLGLPTGLVPIGFQSSSFLVGLAWSILCIWPSRLVLRALMIYRVCPRRNVRDFGRVFLMLNYTDITQNTYIQS